MKNTNINKRKYFYKVEIKYCVLCGKETKTRYRVYEKPIINERMKFIETACNTHFI